MNIENIKLKLQEYANKKAGSDNKDFEIYDCCGGNYDDAYYMGCQDGEICLAREILAELNKD